MPGVEARLTMGNTRTPTMSGGRKYTHKDVRTTAFYSSTLFSNFSPHWIRVKFMPSKNTVFPCVAAVLFIKQQKDLLLWVQLQHRCVLYWLKLCSLTPQLAFLPNTFLLYTLPRFPCNYKEIVALKKKKSLQQIFLVSMQLLLVPNAYREWQE